VPESGDEPEPADQPALLARPAVAAPRLRLLHAAPGVIAAGQSAIEQPGRLTLPLGRITLTFYTNDTVASDDFAERSRQALAMFDQNKDGYLEKDEIPESLQGQLGRFEAVDANDDGKAYPAEIEAFLAQQQAGLRAQIHAKAADRDDLLFAAIDADHDERLDSRDIESIGQRLAALDANGDGMLTPDELPEVLMIGLARGSLENADATFAPPPIVPRGPGANAPRWFTAMDANQDGAISRREFLGTADQFSALDSDGNGLLDAGECAPRSGESVERESSDAR
jgi:Ca2+-binding EF-hand superfamily protein